MPMQVIRRIASAVLSSDLVEGPFDFLWHLGEPLAVPLAFYEQAFAEIARINQDHTRTYTHSFQTNATLLNDHWIDFLRRNQINLGVSLDGPAFIHDRQRVRRNGAGTHADVLKGVRLLQAGGIPFGVIAVLTDFSLDYPDEFYDFFLTQGIIDVGFNIDEIEGAHASTSFADSQASRRYKRFLARLLELNDQQHGAIKFREVWTNLRSLTMGTDEPYNTTNKPLRILNFDAQGNFSTFCPELVAASSEKYGDFVMGNILTDSLSDLFANPVFQLVHQEIERGLTLCKESCAYWNFCGGGSPSNKFFEHGHFDVAETITCRIHKQATVDVLLDYLEAKLDLRGKPTPGALVPESHLG